MRDPDVAYLVCASDSSIRRGGQSGGAVTAVLLHLLASGRIDGAIVTRFNAVTRTAEAVYADTPEAIVASAGSCYLQSPVVKVALEQCGRRLAIVATGCQARAIRKLSEGGKFAVQPIVLGLVCAGNYGPGYVDAIVRVCGCDPLQLRDFRFRDKTRSGWPGEVMVDCGGGPKYFPASVRKRLKGEYRLKGCGSCRDKMNVVADIVFGDPWGVVSDEGQEGRTIMMPRTELGREILDAVMSTQAVRGECIAAEAFFNGQKVRWAGPPPELPTNGGTRRVLVYSYSSESNYGGVSVILGFRELLRQVDPTAEMICVEDGPVPVFAREENDFPSIRWPYSGVKRFWMDYARFRLFGRKPCNPDRAAWWEWFAAVDTVVNLHGIAFCSKLKRAKGSIAWVAAIKCTLKEFSVNLAARISGKLSIKSNASFGPMEARADRLTAWLSSRFAFDRMIARERESALELRRGARLKRRLPVVPDIANLMPVPDVAQEADLVGIVTSFQMERQWKSQACGYIETMVGLVDHIVGEGHRVLLVPNQDNTRQSRPIRRSDSRVAADIFARVANPGRVTVAPVRGRSGLDRKSDIARCALLVSPRYHACVSAMTCGVPTIMIGWHCKYQELAELYGQENWLLSSEKCSVPVLIAAFDRLRADRDGVREDIRRRYPAVSASVLEGGRRMLEKKEVADGRDD